MTESEKQILKFKNFPSNTCPASRHVEMMAKCLAKNKTYLMLTEEPEHCAESMNSVIASLYKLRTEKTELLTQLDAARLDSERYKTIRAGYVYIETADDEFYAVIGENHGKYYSDKRDFDTDLDFFSEVTLPQQQKGETS
jgi:hypothetical protein